MQKYLFKKSNLITIAILGALPLAGCTSSNGISSFADGLGSRSIKQIAFSSAYSKETLEPLAEAPTQVDGQPTKLASLIAPSDASMQQGSNMSVQAYADPNVVETSQTRAEQRIARLYPQISHGTCKNGWGVQAKKLDANRYNPGDPYYIEIRMRDTPPLPIGHTYTAYGRLDANGKKLDEHLVMLAPAGGYVGAGIAGAIPMPAKMKPQRTDCNITPKAAYRVSLSAVQYEKLLLEIKQAKIDRPKYHLFAYNCNHFTSRISEAVGIKTPQNKYTSSLVYIYDIIRENEGSSYKGRRRRG